MGTAKVRALQIDEPASCDIAMSRPGHLVNFELLLKFLIDKCNISKNADTLYEDLIKECREFCNKDDIKKSIGCFIAGCRAANSPHSSQVSSLVSFVNTILEKLEDSEEMFTGLGLKTNSGLKPRLLPFVLTKGTTNNSKVSRPSPDIVCVPEKIFHLANSGTDGLQWQNVLFTMQVKQRSQSPLTVSNEQGPADQPQAGDKRKEREYDEESAFVVTARSKRPRTKRKETQSVSYAREILNQNTRHFINSVVVGEVIYLWWYDRQSALQTTGLNLITEMPYFIAFLATFQRFTPKDWGIDDGLRETRDAAYKAPVDIKFDKIVATITPEDRLLIRAPRLKGRDTWIINASSTSHHPISKKSLKGKQLIIKACLPETSRLNESDIIEYGRQKLLDKPETMGFVQNLPDLIASREVPETDTSRILKSLNLVSENNPETRVFRMHLFSRLVSVATLKDEEVFWKAWIDCFKCHYALWKEGIEHSDISAGNLMWDGERGILNDWDFSYVRGGIPSQSGEVKLGKGNECTGTLPFMAIELLKNHLLFSEDGIPPKKHLYRHDVESFIWVFIWWCLKDSKSDEHARLLDEWESDDVKSVRGTKCVFLLSKREKPSHISDNYWRKCELLLAILEAMLGHKLDDERIHQTVLDIMDGKIVDDSGIGSF